MLWWTGCPEANTNAIAWGIGWSSPPKPQITLLFHSPSQEVSGFRPISLQCIRFPISALLPSHGGVNFITHPRRHFNFFFQWTSGPRDLLIKTTEHNYCHLSFSLIVYDCYAEHTPPTHTLSVPHIYGILSEWLVSLSELFFLFDESYVPSMLLGGVGGLGPWLLLGFPIAYSPPGLSERIHWERGHD